MFSCAVAGLGCNGKDVNRDVKIEEKMWDNGQLQRRESYYVNDSHEKVLHGTQTEWNKNGQKRLEIEYRQGKEDGKHTMWFPSGVKEMVGFWADGKETGLWTWYQPTGDKHSECTYKNGKLQGKKIYWINGKVVGEDVFNDRGKIVELTVWHENGKKATYGTFKNGEKHGRWTYWDSDGLVKAEGEWRNGKPWEGICGVPASGDVGSMAGLEVFARYRKGKLVEQPRH